MVKVKAAKSEMFVCWLALVNYMLIIARIVWLARANLYFYVKFFCFCRAKFSW